MYGFPRNKYETVRTPTPPTEGSTGGTLSGSSYNPWKTEILMLGSVVLAGVSVRVYSIATYTLVILDQGNNLLWSCNNSYAKAGDASEYRYFSFANHRPLLANGTYYRIEMRMSGASKIYYTSTYYDGTKYQEVASWLNNSVNAAHMMMQLSFGKGDRFIHYKYY